MLTFIEGERHGLRIKRKRQQEKWKMGMISRKEGVIND